MITGLRSTAVCWASLGGSVSGPILAGLGFKVVLYVFILGPRLKGTCFYLGHAFLEGTHQSERVKQTSLAHLKL